MKAASDSAGRCDWLSLGRASIEASVGHVNANGLSTPEDDRIEAEAIHDVSPDVPVTAPKSYFGNLGAAAGAMEMAVSVLALAGGTCAAFPELPAGPIRNARST